VDFLDVAAFLGVLRAFIRVGMTRFDEIVLRLKRIWRLRSRREAFDLDVLGCFELRAEAS
jgi:hypothetical protein